MVDPVCKITKIIKHYICSHSNQCNAMQWNESEQPVEDSYTRPEKPNDIMAQLISEMKNKCPWKHFWPPFWQKQSKDFLAFITQTITQKYIYQVMLT